MDKLDISQLLQTDAGALPEEAQFLVRMLLEGRVKQMAFVVESDKGKIFDMFKVIEDSANIHAMVGALELVKRDYMRVHVSSRIEYQEKDEE